MRPKSPSHRCSIPKFGIRRDLGTPITMPQTECQNSNWFGNYDCSKNAILGSRTHFSSSSFFSRLFFPPKFNTLPVLRFWPNLTVRGGLGGPLSGGFELRSKPHRNGQSLSGQNFIHCRNWIIMLETPLYIYTTGSSPGSAIDKFSRKRQSRFLRNLVGILPVGVPREARKDFSLICVLRGFFETMEITYIFVGIY